VTVAGEQIQHRRPNLELRVAPAQVDGILLEDLPKVLTGRRAGEAIRTATRVPAGHPRPEWQNKEVTVSLEIKEVKRLEVPPADDALARRLGYGSLEELSEGVRANLQRRLAEQQRAAMHEQVCRYLMERAALDLPEGAASRLGERALARRYVDLLHRGVPREEIEGNLERLQAVADQQARSELKLALILAKVCEAEKIELDEGEVNARIAEIARRYNRRPERLRQEMDQEGRLDDLKTFLREEKAIERILESASISDGPVSPPEEPEAPAEPPQVEPGPGAQVQVREEPAAVSAEVAAPAGVGQEPRPEPPQAEEPEGAAEPEGAEEPQAVEEQAQAEARPPAEEAKPGKPATKARAKKKPPAGKAKPARKAAPAGKRKGRGKGKDKGR
jgi:hypothetical protein